MLYSFLRDMYFTVKGEKHLKLFFSKRHLDFLWPPNTILSVTPDFCNSRLCTRIWETSWDKILLSLVLLSQHTCTVCFQLVLDCMPEAKIGSMFSQSGLAILKHNDLIYQPALTVRLWKLWNSSKTTVVFYMLPVRSHRACVLQHTSTYICLQIRTWKERVAKNFSPWCSSRK